MKINKVKLIVDDYDCLTNWEAKEDNNDDVYCVDMTINNHWVRVYNDQFCSDNINSNCGLSTNKLNEKCLRDILDNADKLIYKSKNNYINNYETFMKSINTNQNNFKQNR